MTKTLAQYRGLPYARRCQLVVEDGDRYWHAWIEELPGCEIDGATKAEAFRLLDEVFEDYIQAKLEWHSQIPEPTRWPNLARPTGPKRMSAKPQLIQQPPSQSPTQFGSELKDDVRTAETLAGV